MFLYLSRCLILVMFAAAEPAALDDAQSVVLRFEEREVVVQGVGEIEPKEELYVVRYDLDRDGRSDLLLSCGNCVAGAWLPESEWQMWYTYLQNGPGEYYEHMWGMAFSASEILLVKHEGEQRLATVRWNKTQEANQASGMVTTVDLNERGTVSNQAVRILEYNSPQDREWLEEAKAAAAPLVTVYTEEDIAKLRRQAEQDQDVPESAAANVETPPVLAAPDEAARKDIAEPATDQAQPSAASPDAPRPESPTTPAAAAPPAVAAGPSRVVLAGIILILLTSVLGGVLLYWRRRRWG